MEISQVFLLWMLLCIFIELDYFYFSAFDLDVNLSVILKYILSFSEEKHDPE